MGDLATVRAGRWIPPYLWLPCVVVRRDLDRGTSWWRDTDAKSLFRGKCFGGLLSAGYVRCFKGTRAQGHKTCTVKGGMRDAGDGRRDDDVALLLQDRCLGPSMLIPARFLIGNEVKRVGDRVDASLCNDDQRRDFGAFRRCRRGSCRSLVSVWTWK